MRTFADTRAPLPTAPYYVSGRWHDNRFTSTNASTIALTAGRVSYTAAYILAPISIQAVAVNVTTLVAASTVRLGLYSATAGQPGNRLYDWGTVSSAATGPQAVTGLSVSLNPGWYFFATLSVSWNPTLSYFATGSPAVIGQTSVVAGPLIFGFQQDSQSSLPLSASGLAVSASPPAVFYQIT